MRRSSRTTITALAMTTALAARAHATVTSMDYLVTYSSSSAVKVWRGFQADIVVHGSLLDTSTGIEVRDASNNVTSNVTALVFNRTGGANTTISVRITPKSAAALGTYHVLIHYAVEFSGPDRFDVRVYEHGTVSSMQIEEAAEASGLYVKGRTYTLAINGTGMAGAAFDPSAMPSGQPLTLLGTVSTTSTKARFSVRFDTAAAYSIPSRALYDGALGGPPSAATAFPARYDGSSGGPVVGFIPNVATVSPNPAVAGTSMRLSGSHLTPRGYTADVSFTARYRDANASPKHSVSTTKSGSDLTLALPSSMRSDSASVVFTHTGSPTDTLATTRDNLPAFTIALEPPSLMTMPTIGSNGAQGQFKLLVPGSQAIVGKFFTALAGTTPTGALPTVRFGSNPITVTAVHYSPTVMTVPFIPSGGQVTTQVGADSLIISGPALTDTTTQTLTITTSAGTLNVPGVLFAPKPLLNFFEEALSNGTFVAVSGSNTLFRGKTYRLHGDGLEIVSAGTLLQRATLTLNGTQLATVGFSPKGMGFTVPAAAASGTLTIATVGGSTSVPVTIASAPATISVAGVVILPSPVAGGNSITANIAFNGTVSASSGQIVIDTSPADSAIVLPPGPISVTSNPQTVTLQTRAVKTAHTTTLRVGPFNSSSTGSSASITVNPPSPTALTLSPASVAGGKPVTATVQLDASVPASAGITIALTSSDPTTATVPATITASGNAPTFTITTPVVPAQRTVTISATSNGVTRTATLTVNPPTVSAVSLSASSIVAVHPLTATITLSAAPPTPATATITCSDPAVTCPATLSVTGTTATFPITSVEVTAPHTVTVSAALNGGSSSATFTLQPLLLQNATLSPVSVKGGTASSLTVQLNAAQPAGSNTTVQITSGNPALVPNQTITFFSGDVTKIGTLATTATATSTPVTLTIAFTRGTPSGTYTSTKTATLTVTP